MPDEEIMKAIEKRMRLERLKESSIRKNLFIAKRLPITRKELEEWLLSVSSNRQTDILNTLVKFAGYGFVEPEVFKDIPIPSRKQKDLTRDDLLTKDDVLLMIDYANGVRDQALYACLFEVYPRITEFITLERKHFKFDSKGCRITISQSKSETRTFRVIESIGYLKNWLIQRGDAAGLFWYKNDPRKQVELTEDDKKRLSKNIRRRMKTAAKRAGLTKNVYPHLFRYSGYTATLKTISERSAKRIGGWVKGSKVPDRVYDFIDDDDAEEEKLAKHGLIEQKINPHIVDSCPRCGELNTKITERCIVCGMVLKIDFELDEEDVIITRVTERADFIELFMKLCNEERKKILQEKNDETK